MLNVGGRLYGTTSGGGAYDQADGGLGTAFSITTSGTDEKVLHSFGKGTDASIPLASLVDVNGTLYGTTQGGGTKNYGTVFSITTAGKEHVLHSFLGQPHGASPDAGLINVNGTLYGTTSAGGTYNYGTVFSITTAGAEHLLYSFGKGTDGQQPLASLIGVNGTLYGTTLYGGTYHQGTVFSVTTSGAEEKVLHSFGSGTDGKNPVASLLNVNGTLYGTTQDGGAKNYGTVFSLKP